MEQQTIAPPQTKVTEWKAPKPTMKNLNIGESVDFIGEQHDSVQTAKRRLKFSDKMDFVIKNNGFITITVTRIA